MEKPKFFKTENELPSSIKIIDGFTRSLKELFFVRNPQFKKGMPGVEELLESFLSEEKLKTVGVYVYYPWLFTAVYLPEEKIYFELRTARNKNIINEEEQQKYRDFKVGIAGMSVGSNIATTIALTGGSKNMCLADFDEIELTNLNRIRAGATSIGQNKAEYFAKNIYELDPWAELEVYENGLTGDNLEGFIRGLDVFVDEMDSIDLKVRARFIAKKHKIPVLMATDNGYNVIFDVERYDENEDLKIFNGRVEITENELSNIKTFQDWLKIASKIVGAEAHTERMLDSILELGKTLAGVPQLGSAASMAGAVMSYGIRKIACGEKLVSGRYDINLDEKITFNYTTSEEISKRSEKVKYFLDKFGK